MILRGYPLQELRCHIQRIGGINSDRRDQEIPAAISICVII